MVSELLQKFPASFTPSEQQANLINSIDKAFAEGYKFVVCSAPTGSGKSFISKTIGNNSDKPDPKFEELVNSYLIYKRGPTGGYQYEEEVEDTPNFGTFALTITKALQDQYKELFDETDVLKGKSNYPCTYDKEFTVEYAPCLHINKLKETCWQQDSCTYYKARNTAVTSTFATLNYNMFFALPGFLKRKQFIICDEASELEDQIVKEFSCKLSFDFLKKLEINISPFPASTDYAKAGRWISHLCGNIDDRIEELKAVINKNSTKKLIVGLSDTKSDLITLQNLHSKLKTLIDTWQESEYIFERHAKGINFTPFKVDKLAKSIFKYADKVVLMSATIIDPANFCKSLGIDNYKYIEADSTFDASKAPIYVASKVKLNFSNLQSNLPKLVKLIETICMQHENEKGIIHTHTNYITNYLKDNFKSKRVIYREPGIRNEDILEQHYNTEEPTIIASPSMSHGVDLKGDLARFQIVIKAPYLPTTDKRIEKLMKSDFSWYTNKMISSFIQSCGRGVRSKKDYCTTYVLDAAIIETVIRNKNKIPKYFLDRFL